MMERPKNKNKGGKIKYIINICSYDTQPVGIILLILYTSNDTDQFKWLNSHNDFDNSNLRKEEFCVKYGNIKIKLNFMSFLTKFKA